MKDVNCKNSNGIVPYMYGELATSAATEFETHLLECQACTDEFAALSAARYEVYDWKKLEFDPLASPAIRIPVGEVGEVSWIEKLRASFAGSWVMPAAAFAGLALIAVLLAIVVSSRNTGSDVVQRNANAPVNMPANTRKADQGAVATPTETETGVDTSAPAHSAPKPVVVRDSSRRDVRPQPAIAPRRTTPRSTTAQTPTVPRLNEFAEEKDDSLRLAELFEDIDTSE